MSPRRALDFLSQTSQFVASLGGSDAGGSELRSTQLLRDVLVRALPVAAALILLEFDGAGGGT